MCGLVGEIAWWCSPVPTQPERDRVTHTLTHRGPDATGEWADDGVWLGFCRLAILDPQPRSDQPAEAEQGRYRLVYNGEIFNYLELRRELESLGVRFRTTGDTEVVLQSLIAWGAGAFTRFNGMWALAFVDTHRRVALLCRDRFGVKPLFMARGPGGQVLFASEPKALLARDPSLAVPNLDACSVFLRYGLSGFSSDTFLNFVSSVVPGHYVEVDGEGVAQSVRYWSPAQVDLPGSAADQEQAFLHLLTDAVHVRLRSDVPVATTLSGGLDSSMITALAAQRVPDIRSFTADFRGSPMNEAPAARAVAARLGIHLSEVRVPHETLSLTTLGEIVRALDGPTSSPAVVPTWEIMRQVAGHGIRVLLEGQGADELLGGYPSLVMPLEALSKLRKGAFRSSAGAMTTLLRHEGPIRSPALLAREALPGLADHFENRLPGLDLLSPMVRMGLRPESRRGDEPRSMSQELAWEHRTILPGLLNYGDRLSMAHSIEVRLPFMDHRIYEYVTSLPASARVQGGQTKAILRATARGLVPQPVLHGAKKGFPTPVGGWLTTLASTSPELFRFPALVHWGLAEQTSEPRVRVAIAKNPLLLFRMLTMELWLSQLGRVGHA